MMKLLLFLPFFFYEEEVPEIPTPTPEVIYVEITPEPTPETTPDSQVIIEYLEEQKRLKEEEEKAKLEEEEKAKEEQEKEETEQMMLQLNSIQTNGYTSASAVVQGWCQKYRYYLAYCELISF